MAHHKRRSRRRDKLSYFPCGCCVKFDRVPPEIEEDEICMGKAKKAKPRPKKDKCLLNNGKHEWYVENIVETYRFFTGATYSVEYKVSTCIHCFKAKKKHVRRPTRRTQKKVLPKRPVKLY